MKYIHNITHEYDSTYQATTTHETAITLYTFDELGDEARERVVAEYIEERENDPCFTQWFADCYEREIWDAVEHLEKSISGARVNWRYNRWYSCDFDCEFSYDDCYDPGELEPVANNGYWASMDICDAWNKHIPLLNALCARVDGLDRYMWEIDGSDTPWSMEPRNFRVYHRLDSMRSDIIGAWYLELERACDDVRDAIEIALRGEWEWYTSEEYARDECADEATQGYECRTRDNSGRVYYYDSRRWYTVDGEYYGASDIRRKCVSIVKAS